MHISVLIFSVKGGRGIFTCLGNLEVLKVYIVSNGTTR
jgi:hypothetical protein